MARRVLIVDDEQDVLAVLEKGLIAEGYNVIKADNGRDALSLAQSQHPDVIILDVLMPDLDGGEVARELREIPRTARIPVLFLTGMFPKRPDSEQGRIIAGCRVFDKPYDILQLITAIEEAAEKENVTSVK